MCGAKGRSSTTSRATSRIIPGSSKDAEYWSSWSTPQLEGCLRAGAGGCASPAWHRRVRLEARIVITKACQLRPQPPGPAGSLRLRPATVRSPHGIGRHGRASGSAGPRDLRRASCSRESLVVLTSILAISTLTRRSGIRKPPLAAAWGWAAVLAGICGGIAILSPYDGAGPPGSGGPRLRGRLRPTPVRSAPPVGRLRRIVMVPCGRGHVPRI